MIMDHEPLVSLFKTSLTSASPRLSRMLLRIIYYQLDVMYQLGTKMLSHIQISNTLVGYCWCVVKPFIAVLMLYSSGAVVLWGSTLYWVGMDVHGPCYGWSMCQALAMLLVPDIPLTDKKTVKKVCALTLH